MDIIDLQIQMIWRSFMEDKMKSYHSILIGILAIVMLAGCAAQSTGGDITGTEWKWQGSEVGVGPSLSPQDPSQYTLLFKKDGSLDILADCNRVGGSYVIEGVSLSITVGATTLMACPPGSLDTQFKTQLSQANTYELKNGKLYIGLISDMGTMKFSR